MEAHAQYRDPGGLPSILIDRKPSDPFHSRGSGFSRYDDPSPAMSIPGANDHINAPPPLPPPRTLPHHGPAPVEYRDPYYREPTSLTEIYMREHSHRKPDHDEGYASLSTASMGSTRSHEPLPSLSEFGLSHHGFQFTSSTDSYDKDLKKKLDPVRTFSNKSPPGRSLLSASVHESRTRRYPTEGRLAPLSLPANLPIHTRPSVLDSPDRYTDTPLHSAVSPRSGPFGLANGHGGYRSPLTHETSDYDRSPQPRSRRTNSGSLPDDATVSSHDVDEMDIDEAPMSRLQIDEYHATGQKRRASSPPRDEVMGGMTSQSELFRRRDISSRGSPTQQRLGTIQQGSISTISTSRSGSYASNFSVGAPSSVTSMNSYGRRSPGGLSPGGMSPVATDPGSHSPFSPSISLNPSPRGSMSRNPHQRTISGTHSMPSPRKPSDVSKLSSAKMQGFLMCECCPKKPKKFETPEELRAHEAEKQYECSFCGNRFKNKNEAERHQNSLHVRRHSWSCSALMSYDKAFHESTNRPGEADTCGYCGDEFIRTGRGPTGWVVTDQDWDERIRHLTEIHKFRECNSNKKFYRADHFRQHLKHSHAGTSGKWTNMLENACMLDEEPPRPR